MGVFFYATAGIGVKKNWGKGEREIVRGSNY